MYKTSKKIKIDNSNIDLIETNYNTKFLDNINRYGRNKVDNYDLLSDEEFKKKLNEAQRKLKNYNRKIDYIYKNNTFKYFLTLRGINKQGLKRALDRIRKADSNLSYVSLASWTVKTDLHYHILLNTKLSIEDLNKKLKKNDSDIQNIYSDRVKNYIKKNINYDTSYILRQVDNTELKDKQIEILEYSKILSYSKDIKHEPIEIKNPTSEQLEEVYNSTYLETRNYNKIASEVTVHKFIKK